MYAPDGTYRPAFVTHMRANVKYSPEKMWYVAAFCRGKTIDEAFKQLEFMNVKGARIIDTFYFNCESNFIAFFCSVLCLSNYTFL